MKEVCKQVLAAQLGEAKYDDDTAIEKSNEIGEIIRSELKSPCFARATQ